jgi:hypothetical protein
VYSRPWRSSAMSRPHWATDRDAMSGDIADGCDPPTVT